MCQRQLQIVDVVAVGAIAHAELDAEIDAEADEQHRERDRDQIERPDDQKAERRRDREPDEQIEKHREDDAAGFQREPEDDQHDDDSAEAVDHHAFLHGREFLVGDRHRTGQAHARAVVLRQLEIARRLADRIGRLLAGLERGEIELRLDVDELALVVDSVIGAGGIEQLVPGEIDRLLRHRLLDRVRRHGKRAQHLVERDLLKLDAREAHLQHFDQAAQARIGGELGDQRLGLRELAGDLLGLLGRQEQEAVAAEELAAARLRDQLESVFVGGQLVRERGRRLARKLRRRRVDNRQDRLEMLREGLFERDFALTPGQFRRNQRIDVSVNGEMAGRIDARNDPQKDRNGDHRPRMTRAAGYDATIAALSMPLFYLNFSSFGGRTKMASDRLNLRAGSGRCPRTGAEGASTSFMPGRLRGFAGGRRRHVLLHCAAVSHGASSGSGPDPFPVLGSEWPLLKDHVVAIMTVKTTILDAIKTPAELRRVNEKDLQQVADELRAETISAVAVTGGHLGAGLGVVELTVALHYVFDTPNDRLIWDVGHQAYPHKILTGRRDRIRTLRQGGGLSGFTKRAESEYDAFGAAHSSTSISAGLGMAVARDLSGEKRNVIAVIGDGAMSAGMAYEAMNNAGAMNSRLIVILNDNEMSIAPPVGALSAYLARLISGRTYTSLREIGKQIAKRMPKAVEEKALRVEEYARGFLTGGTLFEELGFYYVGPIDGHNLDHLLPVLKNVRDAENGPILVHVVTQKGKGYAPAEASSDKYHGVVKFDVATGKQARPKRTRPPTPRCSARASSRKRARTTRSSPSPPRCRAAPASTFSTRAFPERTFDVGIAEQHGVTFAAGLATEGYKPFAAIYSTFLQRAYDQVVHDVAIQRLPVRFVLDRAGLVGADGPTHAGSFDVAYLGCLPGFVLMAAADEAELGPHGGDRRSRSTTVPPRCAIRAATASASTCRNSACRSRSAKAACCAKAPRSRCCRSARGCRNASRQPTCWQRRAFRDGRGCAFRQASRYRLWCCGSPRNTKC